MIIEGFEFSLTELILLGTFLVVFIYQIWYLLHYINAVLTYSKKLKKSNTELKSLQPGVSVVICARDEVENLREFLPSFLNQDYPEFEIIVVNDGSTDDTELFLTNMKEQFPKLRSTFVPYGATNLSTKKLALTLGIKAAKYDWILLTDADCKPESNLWINNMARNFNQGVEFVLGFSPYIPKKGFLSRVISYDTLFIGLQYLGFALHGKPYMGVGRNLAYRKEVFFRLKGFASNLHLRSGDDDLIVNKAANAFNTKVEVSAQSITWSEPKRTLREWLYQKERHLSVASFYNARSRFNLSIEPIFRGIYYLLFIAVLIFGNFVSMIAVALLFLIRYIIQLTVVNKAAKHFGLKKIFLSLLVLDIYLPLVNLYLVSFGRMGSKSKRIVWK